MGYRRFLLKRTGQDEVLATVGVAPGETLYECLERHRFPIRTTCRGSTICGLCWVHVEDGGEDTEVRRRDERELLETSAPGASDVRLACCLTLPEDRESLTVSTPYWSKPRR